MLYISEFGYVHNKILYSFNGNRGYYIKLQGHSFDGKSGYFQLKKIEGGAYYVLRYIPY